MRTPRKSDVLTRTSCTSSSAQEFGHGGVILGGEASVKAGMQHERSAICLDVGLFIGFPFPKCGAGWEHREASYTLRGLAYRRL